MALLAQPSTSWRTASARPRRQERRAAVASSSSSSYGSSSSRSSSVSSSSSSSNESSRSSGSSSRRSSNCSSSNRSSSISGGGGVYTARDAQCLDACTVFTPPLIDVGALLRDAACRPRPQQVRQVQQECLQTGFLALSGHGLQQQQLQALFGAARRLFDLPLAQKQQLTVGGMRVGRGFEISPEHLCHMQLFQQAAAPPQALLGGGCVEPSAADGILAERFCCGPPLTPQQLQQQYYASELGQVFFPPDAWPMQSVPELRGAMHACYRQFEAVTDAVLRLFAAALGVPADTLTSAFERHHSNMQVANYPAQLRQTHELRKKAHVDSGALTLLAAEDWLPGSTWRPGDGGLQLLNAAGEWVEVAVPQGALLLNLGTLTSRWTNGLWPATLHRVTNPPASKAAHSRRLSVAYFAKPAYDAVVAPLPTCVCSTGGTAAACVGGVELPPVPLFPPARAGDLTRQGILHSLRHLRADEASLAYHERLAAIRRGEV